jgi:hypothetical protein
VCINNIRQATAGLVDVLVADTHRIASCVLTNIRQATAGLVDVLVADTHRIASCVLTTSAKLQQAWWMFLLLTHTGLLRVY